MVDVIEVWFSSVRLAGGQLVNKIAPKIGLDIIKVDLDQVQSTPSTSSTQARVEVGKYLTDRIYLSYDHVFGSVEGQNRKV